MKKKAKGFTLIEILAVIALISVITGGIGYSITKTLKQSEMSSNTISDKALKKSAELYIKEEPEKIIWDINSQTNELSTCVSSEELKKNGFLKLKENTQISYVKIYKSNEVITSIEKVSSCGQLKTEKIKIPNSEYCEKNAIYSGSSNNIDLISTSKQSNTYTYKYDKNKVVDAGVYKIIFTLNKSPYTNYTWDDGTISSKEITCSIKKATPILKFVGTSGGESGEDLGITTFEVSSGGIPGKYDIKTSNKNNAVATIDDKGKVVITKIATRDVITYATITFNPDADKNYNSSTLTYIIGNVAVKRIDKPTCVNNLKYYGGTFNIINNDNNMDITYQYQDTIINGREIINAGTYNIKIRPLYGYVWKDTNSQDEYILNCNIEKKESSFTCDNKTYNGIVQTIAKNATGCTLDSHQQTNASDYNVICKGDDNHSDSTNKCTISRKAISEPTCPSLTYTGKTQVIFAVKTSGEYTNTKTEGINATTYETSFTPTSNYQWNSGTNKTSTRTVTCSIQKANSSFDCDNKTFNGTKQTIAKNATGCTLNSHQQTNASDYNVICKGDDNHSDSTNKCTISRKAISEPTCPSLTYTGKTQVIFATKASGEYTNTKTEGINATTYETSFTPTSNYQWNSGTNKTSTRTVTCSIQKANSSFDCDNKTFNGTKQTIAKNATGCTLNSHQQTNIGEYTISCKGKTNYNDASTKNCKILPQPPSDLEIENKYDGIWINKSYKITIKVGNIGSGVNFIQYKYKNTEWKTYDNSNTDNFTTSNFTKERNEYVYIRACYDNSTCSEPVNTKIMIDKTPPTLIKMENVNPGCPSSARKSYSRLYFSDNSSGLDININNTYFDIEGGRHQSAGKLGMTEWTEGLCSDSKSGGTYSFKVCDRAGNCISKEPSHFPEN